MNLTDTFVIENAELLIEQQGGKTIRRLRGTFGRCDEKNNNGRVYTKPILEREVQRIAEAMSERRLLGELDHPSHDAVKLSNVSHLITGLDFKGNELVGECELLDTPAGKVAQALIEGGVRVGISSRGMGTLSEQSDGTKVVNEDFKLVTFDLVADPSTRGAFPGIAENSQSELVEEIVSETLNKAAQEKVFTTLLKDKLRERLEVGTQSAAWTKETVKEIQKKATTKNPEKPTVEEPFKNWEYFYGWNTGKPKVVKTRSYPDSDSVTAPAEVTENKFCLLKGIIAEDSGSFGVLLQILEALIQSKGAAFRTARKTVRRPGALKTAIAGAAEKVGRKLIGGEGEAEGLVGKLRQTKRTVGAPYKKGRYDAEKHGSGTAEKHVAALKDKVTKARAAAKGADAPVIGDTTRRAVSKKPTKEPTVTQTTETPSDETPARRAVSRKKPAVVKAKIKKSTSGPKLSPAQLSAKRDAEDQEWAERPYARR